MKSIAISTHVNSIRRCSNSPSSQSGVHRNAPKYAYTSRALASAAARSGTSGGATRRFRSPSNSSEELALLCRYL